MQGSSSLKLDLRQTVIGGGSRIVAMIPAVCDFVHSQIGFIDGDGKGLHLLFGGNECSLGSRIGFDGRSLRVGVAVLILLAVILVDLLLLDWMVL